MIPRMRPAHGVGKLARRAKGLFVADGSVLNRLPAKSHTLTIMANAERIGRAVAARIGRAPAEDD